MDGGRVDVAPGDWAEGAGRTVGRKEAQKIRSGFNHG